MAIEGYDESQGKPIESLVETMILDDETSYFLTTLDDVTRKINLLNIAKALSGDEEGENSEFKFYTTKAIKEQLIQVYSEISSIEGLYEQYNKILESLRTSVDTSLRKLELTVNNIDPKIKEMYDKVVKEFESNFNDLANQDNKITLRINDIYSELSEADLEIIKRFDTKFNELTGMVDSSGDLADSLFNILNEELTTTKNRITSIYNELKSQDASLTRRIRDLEAATGSSMNMFGHYYTQTQVDNKLKEIYEKFKVKVISSPTDSSNANQNLNNYTESGMYFFTQTANAANLPSGCVNGILFVIDCTGGITKQIFYRYGTINTNDHQMFIRTRGSNVWSDWARVLTTKDIIYGTSVPTSLENGQIYLQYFL